MHEGARNFLTQLVDAPGPVGQEGAVVATWLKYVGQFADETYTDSYGNGFAVLNSGATPTVMLEGHADELGLMVSYIDEEGFLWVTSLGGYDPKILPSMRVKVLATGAKAKGPLPGVIGAMPPHMQRPEAGDPELRRYRFGENVYVDIGAKNQAEAAKYVRVGDAMVLDYGLADLRRSLVIGRGLDNKIGIWAAAEGLRRCAERRAELQCSVVAVAAVQEEIGGHGARMASFRIDPDVALVVDVTQSVDHPGTEKKRWGDVKLGQGPVLAHGSACHRGVVERLERVAASHELTLQHEAAPRFTGTDADEIYKNRQGIPSAVISLPQRYMHSPAEMVNLEDLDAIAELLKNFCLDVRAGETFNIDL
jgi:putative aminopeptidase FrvX